MNRLRPGFTHLGVVFLLLALLLYFLGHSVLGLRSLEGIAFFLLALLAVVAGEAWLGPLPGPLTVWFAEPVHEGEQARALWRLESLGGGAWGGATISCRAPGGRQVAGRATPGGRDAPREGNLGQWRFARRGKTPGPTVHLKWLDPVGLAFRRRSGALPAHVTVLPRRVEVLTAAGAPVGRGLPYSLEEGSPVNREGSSQDVMGVRPYDAGDSLRRIHWRATGKKGKYMVTQFHHLEGVGAWLALAAKGWTRPGGGAANWEDGIAVAAGWAWRWATSGSPVGLWVEGIPEATVFPIEGSEALNRIRHTLAGLPPQPPVAGDDRPPDGRAIWVLPAARALPAGHRGVVVPARPLPAGPAQVEWRPGPGGMWLPGEARPL